MPGACHSWDVWSKGHGLWRTLTRDGTCRTEVWQTQRKHLDGRVYFHSFIFFSSFNFLISSDFSIMEAKSERGMSVSFHENQCCKVEMICAKTVLVLKSAEYRLIAGK